MALISIPLITPFGYDSNSNPYTGAWGSGIVDHIGKFPVMYNCVVYSKKDVPAAITPRPAFTYISTSLPGSPYRGALHQTDQDYFVINATGLYRDLTFVSSVSLSLNTDLNHLWWAHDENYVFFSDFTTAYYLDLTTVFPGTLTQVTDLDYPGNISGEIVVGAINLDGYFFVGLGNGRIYNSALLDPSSWTATDFVTAELETDGLQTIAKHHNHLVALGTSTVEFFYNAGTPVGSPLQRRQDVSYNIGVHRRETVAEYQDLIFFVGNTNSVYMLDSFNLKKISTAAIDQFLEAEVRNDIANSLDGDRLKGDCIIIGGKLYYILSDRPQVSISETKNPYGLVYDVSEDLWYIWDIAINSSSEKAVIMYDPVNNVDDALVLTGSTDEFQDLINTGVSYNILSYIVSNTIRGQDGFEQYRKFMHDFFIVGKKLNSTQNFSISWTEDNYNTFTSSITYDLNSTPKINRMGSFRERAYKIAYAGGARFNISSMGFELKYGFN